jgi:release factor glutamine methyltransferase
LPDDEDRSASGTAGSATRAGNVAEQHNIAALLQQACAQGLDRLDAELLLARATGLTRAALRAHGEQQADAGARAQFEAECARRRSGEPLAYIEGHKEFWSLPLQVSPAVLVPRPETELLVERCLALLPAGSQRVADLGTGSGAIGLALAHERPDWSLVAVDASPAALAVAQANAHQLGLSRVAFRLGSWCDSLGDGQFDAIVSNPPYVAPGDPALAVLAHEPLSALAAADDGYADLLTIADHARSHLRPAGWLLLEHGSTQAQRLATELTALGYAEVTCHPDLAGLPRVTQARWLAAPLPAGA